MRRPAQYSDLHLSPELEAQTLVERDGSVVARPGMQEGLLTALLNGVRDHR